MRILGDTIKTLSTQMNDQRKDREYSRWTRPMWLEYVNEGLSEIGAYRPDAFAASVEIPLVSGTMQTLPEGAQTLVSIEDNGEGVAARESDAIVASAFATYNACPSKVQMVNGRAVYGVKSFAINSLNPRAFMVSPPVPATVPVTITATVQNAAPLYTLADWNEPIAIADKYYNNLLDFATARAYAFDTESQVSLTESKKLFSLFYQTMGAKYKIDSAYGSGYYGGQVGTGDPRARI